MNQRKNWPFWLKKRVNLTSNNYYTWQIINDLKLNTVCFSACCPNLSECFSKKQATFLILGNNCTRHCRFCAIKNNRPKIIDNGEPQRVAQAVKELNLNYVVITSVTRDDLSDGGASQFAKTVRQIRQVKPGIKIEVLTPDFGGKTESIKAVSESKPDVFNHNIETVPRLYNFIRPQAQYARSLKLLSQAKQFDATIITKSGLMLGLGEKENEVVEVLEDLIKIECQVLTLGQYLKPTKAEAEVKEFIYPEQFKRYEKMAKDIGFKHVFSGPWVRSSYCAQEIFEGSIN